MQIDVFFDRAWDRYSEITPDAGKIHDILESRGETVVNDHVAFRTFNIPGIDRFSLGKLFEAWGYRLISDLLEFPEKKLKANYWLHSDPSLPKVFISELILEEFPADLQNWIWEIAQPLLGTIQKQGSISAELFLKPTWQPVRWEDYQHFYPISEYAAWTAAYGIQVNHFTVLVNQLKTVSSLQELNQILAGAGFTLNQSGGVIKGTPDELLEQSSTVAGRIPWKFENGITQPIMSCYYEFARRYPVPGTQQLFQGFVPKSADKIFESNFEKK
jgi:hypothetical protein